MAAYTHTTRVLKRYRSFALQVASNHACMLLFFCVDYAGFSGPSHLYLGDFELPASREGSTRHKMGNAQSKGGVVNDLLNLLVTKTLQTLL